MLPGPWSVNEIVPLCTASLKVAVMSGAVAETPVAPLAGVVLATVGVALTNATSTQ